LALTADVKDELARIDVSKTTVRAAELATILRFSGGLHLISGRIAVESELDTAQLARRVRKDLAELYGVKSEISTGERRSRARPVFWMPAAVRSAVSLTSSPPAAARSWPPSGGAPFSRTALSPIPAVPPRWRSPARGMNRRWRSSEPPGA
jgi:hypothetical protein